ncbi:MAG: Ig-like domain-containing protein [Prevotella sp.]|nr:Ig-like domain-containing protein [Prevotella sp.]
MKKLLLFCWMVMLCAVSSQAAITITEQGGWFEAGYVTWTGDNQDYTVYIRPEGGSYTAIDKELVRKYADYYRADMVGLKAGNYQFKIEGKSNHDVVESDVFYATPHDRSGFAHVGMPGGIGAYKNDGTLKDNARVIYVTANTAKTVKCNVSDGKTDTEYTGLQAIIAAFEKGKETRPLAIRIVGTVKKADCDSFGSSAEGIQVKGKSGSVDMNITIEGIGNDATTHGFGFLIRNACSIELRNFANMICMDDCVSLDTDNHHVWVHNMDFFYGGTGGDSDQAKGDGTVDIKGKSSHITVSYNHFYDSGKCSLGGMKSETEACWMTYHHNWFDHSDSRHPRIRTAFYHCYNNYYDGNSKYGVGVTCGGSSFVEANYFRNCKYPMLISKQGTDAEGSGTFSGENGGVNKAYNNVIINPRKVQYYDGSQTDGKWDAVLVDNRDDEVTAKAFTGGTSYNSAADVAARTTYIENKMDNPEDIPEIVRGTLGAGRLQHGDFKWVFNNSLQDENYDVIGELKTALVNYESTVISFADGTALSSRTPATSTVDGGDGKGIDQETNDAYVPSWAGGGGSIASGKQVIGEDGQYFWFNAANATQVNTYLTDGGENGVSTISTTGEFKPSREITNSKVGSCSDYIGSILIPSKGHLTLYNAAGISSAAFYVSSGGEQTWQISVSTDGNSFTNMGSAISGKTAEHPTAAFTDAAGTYKYVRITNTNSSARDVQGIKVYVPLGASDLTALTTSTIEINESQTYTLTKGTDYSTSCTGAITYKSSSTKVATIDENGKITPLSQGKTTITLTQANDELLNGGTLTFKVEVTDNRAASDLTLATEAEVTVNKGNTLQISATCSNALTYTSGAPSIATVSNTGLITAVAFGTATITVSDPGSATHRPGQKTIVVTVPDNRAVSALAVTPDEITVNRNATTDISTTVSNAKGAVSYRSTDEEIATVNAAGVVTGILSGEAVIVVSDQGDDTTKPGTVNVTVKVNDPRAASLFEVTSNKDVTIDLAAAVTSNITTSGAAGAVTYESSDETVVSVSAEGVMTGKKAGTAVVTVKDAGNDSYLPKSVDINVTVLAVPTSDPVTWAVSESSTLKSGTSISNGGTAIFISTDGSASELQYIGGSNCKIEVSKGVGTFKMGGATQYSSNVLSTRYFVLPALSGSGTLSVTYGSSNQSNLTIKKTTGKNDEALATITKTATSVELTDLDNTVLYISAASKAYLSAISWTPSAPDARAASTFALTSTNTVQVDVDATSAITYTNAAGAVTFESDNTSVATVDAEGVIKGVAAGTATITVKDAGSAEVKGATLTIVVTVGSGSTPGTEVVIYDFNSGVGTTTAGTGDAAPAAYTAPTSFKLGANAQYIVIKPKDGEVFKSGDKVSIVGQVGGDNKTVGLCLCPTAVRSTDFGVYASSSSAKNTDTEVSGTLTLTTDATELYLFRYDTSATTIKSLKITRSSSTGIQHIDIPKEFNGAVYDLMGRKVQTPKKGQVYIINGRKVLFK